MKTSLSKKDLKQFSGETITVATWNILSAPSDVLARMSEAAAWMQDVDVLCVQEAVHGAPGSAGTAHILADKLGMEVASLTHQNTFSYGVQMGTGTAVLSKLPVLSQNYIDLTSVDGEAPEASLALLETPNGTPLYVVSAHLEWGGHSEPKRLAQAVAIEKEMRARVHEYQAAHGVKPLVLLGMDANALPDSDTIRYLTGLNASADAESALWIDIWKNVGVGEGYTSIVKDNPHAIMTAQTKNILRPDLIPPRRIDYLMMRGWLYGSAGMPLSTEVRGCDSKLGETVASDHCAVVATIWDPKASS